MLISFISKQCFLFFFCQFVAWISTDSLRSITFFRLDGGSDYPIWSKGTLHARIICIWLYQHIYPPSLTVFHNENIWNLRKAHFQVVKKQAREQWTKFCSANNLCLFHNMTPAALHWPDKPGVGYIFCMFACQDLDSTACRKFHNRITAGNF